MTANNFIFVDGFSEVNFSFALPVIKSYAQAKGITDVVIYKTNLRALSDYHTFDDPVVVRNYNWKDSFYGLFQSISNVRPLLKTLLVGLSAISGLTREDFRVRFRGEEKFESGIRHAIYDSLSKKYPISYAKGKFRLIERLSSINIIFRHALIYSCVTNANCKAVFLGHIVYHTRLCFEYCIYMSRPLVVHGGYNFSQILNWDDPPPPIVRSSTIGVLKKGQVDKDVSAYIEDRNDGSGKNPDILELANGCAEVQSVEHLGSTSGYILCYVPVLGDSPFGWIDRDRIFCDVLDWLVFTRDFCLNQKVTLVLKLHPSSRVWGEDTELLLKTAGIHRSEYCEIIRSDVPPSMQKALISRARQVVTFKGTIALETISHGWTVIVISRNVASLNIPEAVIKPRTISQYRALLLDTKLSTGREYRQLANQIIYAQDNQISFASLINAKAIFSGLSKEEKMARSLQIMSGASKNAEYFLNIGRRLSEGHLQTTRGELCRDS